MCCNAVYFRFCNSSVELHSLGVVLEIDIQSNRTSPFIGAYSFPSNTGLMCKVMQIVILLTLPSIYRAILPSPESHGKWRFDCIW